MSLHRAFARLGLLCLTLILAAAPAVAQERALLDAQREATSADLDYYFPDGVSFAPGVPSPEDFLGYPVGSYHTRHDLIVAYMKELAASSERATYQEIGRTYEHRPMPVLTVTSPENHARLEEIRQRHIAAADPNGEPAASGELPAIVHLGYGVTATRRRRRRRLSSRRTGS